MTQAHQATDHEEKKESGGQTSRKRRDGTAEDADCDAGLAAEAVGEEAKRNTADGENDQEKGLQRAQLGVCNMEMIAQEGNQRDEDLPSGEVDKIDQRDRKSDV